MDYGKRTNQIINLLRTNLIKEYKKAPITEK